MQVIQPTTGGLIKAWIDGVQIDDKAVVSHSSDGGAYVMAWVWVPQNRGTEL